MIAGELTTAETRSRDRIWPCQKPYGSYLCYVLPRQPGGVVLSGPVAAIDLIVSLQKGHHDLVESI